ncbi:MAG: 3-phosphoshikimate 1-carboxyvinyltransferase [Clostridiales bacterium]|jgi:3-phosphoshikimate 1-carboxyvinyltransferase|nr:3-phosphoshikimate 1-carboxyvinyltransferase [Clostridiales bacterium]
MNKIIKPCVLKGKFKVPGDKSISHRAIMLGALAEGDTEAEGFLTGDDCLSTIGCFRELGVEIAVDTRTKQARIRGRGLRGLRKPAKALDVGNSGTTIRLLAGILAGQGFSCELTGDESIRRRPMARVIEPLRAMGARADTWDGGACAPILIEGRPLRGIEYHMPISSAQVKSAIMLAGLYAEGKTVIYEPQPSRDHMEIMLRRFGADIEHRPGRTVIRPGAELKAAEVRVPGDISSAAFLIAAALITPGSKAVIENVGVNPTRTGIITAFRAMGADIRVENQREISGELVADIEACGSRLYGGEISGGLIPLMIDEIPVFAAAAVFAEGRTIIRDAQELKVKESNRISAMASELVKFGADVEETDDGLIINGRQGGAGRIHGAEAHSHGDHRVAMSLAVLGSAVQGETVITGAECVDISFPGFFEILGQGA